MTRLRRGLIDINTYTFWLIYQDARENQRILSPLVSLASSLDEASRQLATKKGWELDLINHARNHVWFTTENGVLAQCGVSESPISVLTMQPDHEYLRGLP